MGGAGGWGATTPCGALGAGVGSAMATGRGAGRGACTLGAGLAGGGVGGAGGGGGAVLGKGGAMNSLSNCAGTMISAARRSNHGAAGLATTATCGAATPVEEHDANLGIASELGQCDLGLLQGPARSNQATILGAV